MSTTAPATSTPTSNPKSIARHVAALTSLFLFGLSTPSHGAADQDLSLAVAAYRSGNNETALQYFQQALRAGLNNATIQFDIALCYYRLRRYKEAESYFLQLTRDPDFKAASEYHLGLIAYQRGDIDGALQRLNTAQSLDPRLKTRVGLARARITGQVETPITAAYLRAGTGYDSNVNLAPDKPDLTLAAKADGFLEAQAGLEYRRDAYSLGANLFDRSYLDQSDFDQLGLSLYGGRSWSVDHWTLGASASSSAVRLGNERFQELLGPALSLLHRGDGPWQQRARFSSDRIFTPGAYSYLRGWRSRLELSVIASRAQGSYEFEYNQREDVKLGDEFFSYSPMRHKLSFSTRFSGPASIETSLLGEARYSRSSRPDRYSDGIDIIAKRRQEKLGSLSLTHRLPLMLGIRPFLETRGTINRSNIGAYDYDKVEVIGGFEWY